jgi:hypothetical protein
LAKILSQTVNMHPSIGLRRLVDEAIWLLAPVDSKNVGAQQSSCAQVGADGKRADSCYCFGVKS